jgi:myosin heavy subunit
MESERGVALEARYNEENMRPAPQTPVKVDSKFQNKRVQVYHRTKIMSASKTKQSPIQSPVPSTQDSKRAQRVHIEKAKVISRLQGHKDSLDDPVAKMWEQAVMVEQQKKRQADSAQKKTRGKGHKISLLSKFVKERPANLLFDPFAGLKQESVEKSNAPESEINSLSKQNDQERSKQNDPELKLSKPATKYLAVRETMKKSKKAKDRTSIHEDPLLEIMRERIMAIEKKEARDDRIRHSPVTTQAVDTKDIRDDSSETEEAVEPQPLSPEEIEERVENILSMLSLLSNYFNSAASVVQAKVRGRQAKRLLFLHRQARTIQTCWRAGGPRKAFKEHCDYMLYCHMQATKIQSFLRMCVPRFHWLRHHAAKKIQAQWRGHSARSSFIHRLVLEHSATAIQSAWRGFVCYAEYTFQLSDIMTVQRIARGYLGRKRFKAKWRKRELKRIYNQGAMDIQRSFRGFKGRKRASSIRAIINACTTIQAAWRGNMALVSFCYQLGCILMIQKIARGYISRTCYQDDLGRVIISQSTARRWLARRRFCELHAEKLQSSATLIQSLWRAAVARECFHHNSSARTIQAAWRCYIARQKFLQYIIAVDSAVLIQSAWRGFVCYTDYLFKLADIITAQRVSRGFLGRKRFRRKWQKRELKRLRNRSATHIQRVYRGFKAREDVAAIKMLHEAATSIQKVWRGYSAHELFLDRLDCIIQIQATVRGFLSRIAFADDLGCIIVVQRAIRTWRAKKIYKQAKLVKSLYSAGQRVQSMEKLAARVLQLWYTAVIKPGIQNRAAIKLQCFFRMTKAMVDIEMKKEIERRKFRKLLKNRDAAFDDKMLEDAWDVMSIADDIDIHSIMGRSEVRGISDHSDESSHRKSLSVISL